MKYTDEAKQNFKALSNNPYPGRGIILGESADGKSYVQVYWIMGRSVNSRNRVFEIEPKIGFMKTKAFDESKLTDPHLIIYYPARHTADVQIITNGDQTDTIYDANYNISQDILVLSHYDKFLLHSLDILQPYMHYSMK